MKIINYKEIPLGVLDSPIDERDYTLASCGIPIQTSYPEEFCLEYKGKIKNQGQVGSCVAHSLSYCKEMIETKQGGEYKQFSVGFIYGNRYADDFQGVGMNPREALIHLSDEGNCLYEDFPINEEYPNIVNTLNGYDKKKLLEKAFPYRVTSFLALKTNDEIKTALIQLGPVTASMRVYDTFYHVKSDGIVPPDNGQYYGNHMVTIIGWTKDNKWICLNSWGKVFGDHGKFYIPFDLFIEKYSITDNILPVTPPKVKTYYKVQLGAFKIKENADNLAKELKNKNIATYIISDKSLIRIQCGSFTNFNNANNMKNTLIGLGYKDAFIVTIQK